MRTLFTSYDIKEIIEKIYNGNLKLSKASNGQIPYVNENSEKILFTDEYGKGQIEKDLAEYLNIKFYSWKNRLVEKGENVFGEQSLISFDDWASSLNFSMDESYALVELVDEEVTASQDIDSATKIGKITFLIQANKISNLDYYVSKIKNHYLGNPQDIQNSYGNIIKAYITMGALIYDEEPITMQLGECIVASCNFSISYLTDALSYNDTEIQISLDGDDIYDVDGNIVGETKYLTMPLTKITWQNIFTTNPLPTAERPDLTGFVATALSNAKTLTFYDFNKELSMRFNDLFWRCNCIRYDGHLSTVRDVNIPIYVRIKNNGHSYVYKDVIEQMEKTITNNDFNISSLSLKGWGKISDFDKEYVLSFDSRGGNLINPKQVTYGQEIGELPVPIKTGYTFTGWYIDDTQITSSYVWNFNTSKMATASWVANQYTLTLDSNNGETATTKTVTFGQPIGTLPTPTKSGYTFTDWKIGSQTINSATVWNYTENKTAIANYEVIWQNVQIGTNIRNKQLKIELYTGQNILGDTIFGFEDNSDDYIRGRENEFGFWGHGIFSSIALEGEDQSQVYTLTIPNDKDYIVERLAIGFGVEVAQYGEI